MANETLLLDLLTNNYGSSVAEDNNSKFVNDSREESSRVCPLCNSEVRLFFINFNEKLLMCANTECEFPFGHEELQFVKEDEDSATDNENVTMKTNRSGSFSTISLGAWSEIDKLNRAYESEDSHLDNQLHVREKTLLKKTENEDTILKNIQDIKVLTKELREVNTPTEEDENKYQITNPKWIKNLKNLGQISGFQLLKPEEIGLLRKEEPAIGLGELKIDIDPGNSACMSSIKIEIHNNNMVNNEPNGPGDVTVSPESVVLAREQETDSEDGLPI